MESTRRRDRAEHRSASPWVHRALRMPAHYNAEPLGRIGHDPFTGRAVVLAHIPAECPRCWNPCLEDRGLEAGCPLCGWEQVVRLPAPS